MSSHKSEVQLSVGSKVRVPWGLNRDVEGTVLEVWGDPPSHVRVELHLDDDESEPVVLLLAPSMIAAA
jgi:primosomal protein N'